MERNYFMVRAMLSREQDFSLFQENGVVAVGWSEVPFFQYMPDIEQLRKKVDAVYYSGTDVPPQVKGRWLNAVARFCAMRAGDYIIVPYYSSVLFAEATGELIFSENDAIYDLANQQKVTYQRISGELKSIPRDNLSEALQRRLRVRGAIISDLGEFKDEIEALFRDDAYSFQKKFFKSANDLADTFKATLLDNIRNGKTNLKTGGIGLEELVRELFKCEGYSAVICSKRRFAGWGDADVEAIKSDKFSEVKLLAQVKHHTGVSDEYGVRQLQEILNNTNEYDDYLFVFITTARISKEAQEQAQMRGIILIDGEEFIDWLFIHLDGLSEQTKAQLGISTIPQMC